MKYIDFDFSKELNDKNFPMAKKFAYEDALFYVEPTFYSQLMGMKMHHPNSFPLIMRKIKETIKKNKKVIFTGDFESPYVEVDGFIYREITDITDPLLIFVEDKSRGSDYGD